jgi:tRNA threonylcarbamoyladenosine biosynthesis protein TsaB
MIQDVLFEAKLQMSDITKIGVTKGPGTFTGTRIAVATARALALAQRVPVVGLSSLALLARGFATTQTQSSDLPPRNIVIGVEVGRAEVYAQTFDSTGRIATSEPELMSKVAAQHMAKDARAVYVDCAAHNDMLEPTEHSDGSPRLGSRPDARHAIDLLLQINAQACAITPLYLRPPDAKPAAAMNMQRR